MRIRSIIAIGLSIIPAIIPATMSGAAETVTYSYDAKGRLVAVAHSGSVNNGVTASYVYDQADNRRTVAVSGSPNPPPP